MKNVITIITVFGVVASLCSKLEAYTVMTDNFTNRLEPQWQFIDSNAAGSPWNLVTDSTTPLSGTAMTNPYPTTQALQQWDSQTLAATNDYVQVSMSIRTPATQSVGTFAATLFNTPTAMEGNSFGATSYPLASINGYTYGQAYASALPTAQRVLNNVGTTIKTAATGAVLGNAAGHTVILKLTRVATGLKIDIKIDGVDTSYTDTTPSSYVFNTLRIDGGGAPINIDNVVVTSSLPGTNFTFTLPHTYTTSAGVFDSSGTLVRNLWKNLSLPAAAYTQSWNNKNDAGVTVAAGTYTIKVLTQNTTYTWEGVIGNTSSDFCTNIWHSLAGPANMSIDPSGNMFVSVGYNEGEGSILRSTLGGLGAITFGVGPDGNTLFYFIAADGTNFYTANIGIGGDTYNSSFVFACKESDNSLYIFPNGAPANTSGDTYNSAIDYSSEIASPPVRDQAFVNAHAATGLAVQTNGNMLAVAHYGANQVRLFDKTSGSLLNTISVPTPQQIGFAPSGDLWVISGTNVLRYTGLPSSPSLATTISGFSGPLSVAVSPLNNDIVLVADGGTSQQVKCFNHTGTAQWTLGLAGGYPANGPDVASNKFWFVTQDYIAGGANAGTFVAFQPDGTFWVGDIANDRMLHYNASQVYQGQVAWVPDKLWMTVDQNNPTRVFSGWLEYQVDYTKPLLPGDPDPAFGGNGSWKLVKNWGVGLNRSAYSTYFQNVVTLSNGRTYAQCFNAATGNFNNDVFELPATGPARLTGVSTYFTYNMYPDGDLRWSGLINNNNPSIQDIMTEPLTGFDGSGNPQWGAATVLASAPVNTGNVNQYSSAVDPFAMGGWGIPARMPTTASNVVLSFNPSSSSDEPNNHLGGIPVGGSSWLWESSPGSLNPVPDGMGDFDDNASFGGHDGIAVYADNHDVIYGYDGQYGSFSSQWMHFYDDGLFVGQFGVTDGSGTDQAVFPQRPPGFAGNIATSVLVNNAGTNYVYCGDEIVHSGVHRWRIDGGVTEASASGALNTTLALGTAAAWPTTNLVSNPGFESEAATYTLTLSRNIVWPGYEMIPAGWQVNNGTDGSGVGAFWTQWNGTPQGSSARSLPYHATISKSSAYTVNPFQIITAPATGKYTLSAWVQSTGGQTSATLYCNKTPLTGTPAYTVAIPTASAWTQISIPNISLSANGKAEIGFKVQGNTGQTIFIDDVSFVKQ